MKKDEKVEIVPSVSAERVHRFVWGDDEEEEPLVIIRYDEEARAGALPPSDEQT